MASDAEGQCLLPRTAGRCQRPHYQRLLMPREGGRSGGSRDPQQQGAAGSGCKQQYPSHRPWRTDKVASSAGAWEWMLQQTSARSMLLKHPPGDRLSVNDCGEEKRKDTPQVEEDSWDSQEGMRRARHPSLNARQKRKYEARKLRATEAHCSCCAGRMLTELSLALYKREGAALTLHSHSPTMS